MARRRRTSRKKKGVPAWLWLLSGVLIGLSIATAAIIGGYIPQPEPGRPAPVPDPSIDSEPLIDSDSPEEQQRPRYDFFTVLPEMEVVVPEQELREQAQADTATAQGEPYVIQVGSFRNAEDADRMKARLALMGMVANIQTVTVNYATWHRVRLGPYHSAREVDRLQGLLRDNEIDSRVFRDH